MTDDADESVPEDGSDDEGDPFEELATDIEGREGDPFEHLGEASADTGTGDGTGVSDDAGATDSTGVSSNTEATDSTGTGADTDAGDGTESAPDDVAGTHADVVGPGEDVGIGSEGLSDPGIPDSEAAEHDAAEPAGGQGSRMDFGVGRDAEGEPEVDPFADVAGREGDPFEGPQSAFREMDVESVDPDAVWEGLESAEARGSVGEATKRTYAEVSKHSYCEQCEYFSEPPDIDCSHEDTEIVEFLDMETVRVVDCPIVAERREIRDEE